MANPFPFSVGAVLTAAQMNGIGEVTAFTPTWSGLTVGNGTQNFKYVRVQNLIYITGKLTFGSTTAITGNIAMAVPVATTNQTDVSIVGETYLTDAGVGNLIGFTAYSGGFIFCQVMNVAGVYPTPQAFGPTTPFTWSVNDSIGFQAVYTV